MASDAIHFLTAAPVRDVAEQGMLPVVRQWFETRFGEPTRAQRLAWPTVTSGQNLLLSAPTGNGKTLAAFLPIVNHLLAHPKAGLQCLYIAPLKALVRDVRVNLNQALRSLYNAGANSEQRVGLRTGDTSYRVRRRQLTHPPAILLTTPESLAQLLASVPSQELFRQVRWIVVDEIHALIGNKRGADLAVSLERLEELAVPHDRPIQRIGLSATCAPLATVAEFLVGVGRPCTVAATPDRAAMSFVIEPLDDQLAYSPGWLATLVDRLERELTPDRTTLIFTNTRNLAERVTWALRRRYPDRHDEIAVHHSAIAPARRRVVERCLKQGRLWIAVSSTSLELGIDIGAVDQVVFVHPPGDVARLIQRVGRSGHRPGQPRRGLILTASPSELLEAAVTAGSGRDGLIEPVQTIDSPLDVLCQQLVGMAMTGLWSVDAAFDLVRRAAPFQRLTRRDFDDCVDYLAGRQRDGTKWLPPRLHMEGNAFTIRDARTAKLMRRNLGTILTEDACAIRMRAPTVTDASRTQALGEVDQAYAERLQTGDRFMLDGRCLELVKREWSALVVDEVFGRPLAPRWLGIGVPTSRDLARRIFLFRAQAAEMLRDGDQALLDWLAREHGLSPGCGEAIAEYVQAQERWSEVPTLSSLLIECVSMQACTEFFVHTPLPRSANEAIARVLLHRWRRPGRAQAMAVAADLGLYVLAPTAEAIAPACWREALSPAHFADDFREHLAGCDLLAQQFARVAATGLMVLRNPAGRQRKVGGKDWAERRLFDQLCQRDPDFVLLRQAEREVMSKTCDVPAALEFARTTAELPIRVRQLDGPSPFGEALLGNDQSAVKPPLEVA